MFSLPLFGLVSSLPADENSDGAAEHGEEGEHEDDDPGQSWDDDEEKILVAATLGAGLAVPQEPH